MSMIDPKVSRPESKISAAIRARDEIYRRSADRPFLTAAINDAITDVEAGVEFWKTIAGKRRLKRGISPEFLNRSG